MRHLLASRVFVAFVAAVLGAGAVAAVWAITDEDDATGSGGEVRVVYESAPREGEDLIRRAGVFDRAARAVNEELDLPEDLTVSVVGDRTAARLNVAGPVYEPKERTVYFPWSFIERSHAGFERLSKKSRAEIDRIANLRELDHERVDRLVTDAMVFVFFHETAHGLLDVLDVPVVGGEEPTADSLAAIFAIASGFGGQQVVLSGAALEAVTAEEGGQVSPSQYADDHDLDQQRAFDALCLVYGSAPDRNRNLVGGPGDLTPQRAELCPFEYRGDLRSWRRLLAPWLTDRGGLLPVRD